MARVTQAATAYQQYIDTGTAGTTVTYSRYDSGGDKVFIYKKTVIEASNMIFVYNQKANDHWGDKDTATYEPIND